MKTPEENSNDKDNRVYPLHEESWCLDRWETPEESKPSESPSEETLSIRAMLTTKGLKMETLNTSSNEKDES